MEGYTKFFFWTNDSMYIYELDASLRTASEQQRKIKVENYVKIRIIKIKNKIMINQLKQPFNIVTLVIALISLGLSIFFYQNSKKTRSISYQVTQPIIKIFDKENATPKIKLLKNDSVLINDNVYLLTGKIWNSGNLSILPSDVRKDLTIELDISNIILDYKITNEKESGISNFKLDLISANKLSLNWDYFDPNYGLVFQIMFLGKNDNPNFQLNGKVLEVSQFIKVDFIEDDKKFYNIMLSLFSMLLPISFLIVTKKDEKTFSYWLMLGILIILLVITIYSIYTSFVFFDKIPL